MLCIKCKQQIDDDSIFCKHCGKKQTSTAAPKPLKRANGMGSVSKLSGRRRKPWKAQITTDKGRILLGTYATRTEALRALESASLNSIPELFDITVGEVYDAVLKQNAEKLTKNGLTNYRSGYIYLEQFSDMKMREIRTAHIQRAINDAHKAGIGHATWKKIQNIASLMCKYAMANDVIDKNYALLVTFPAAAKKSDKVSFTDEQLDRLWELWERDEAIVGILALCYNGLRINEFLSLRKADVDIKQRIIYTEGSKTNAGKNRIIAISQDVVPLYERMMLSDGVYLYPSPSGNKWDVKNYRDRVFYPTLKKYGLDIVDGEKITPHSCRHTYAALCVKHNLNAKATMDLIGHSKISTTMDIYANSTKKNIDFLRSEADKIKRNQPS